MPLINGVKMACEPCIRGHRSTKCTHTNERLMVSVRKPGRPLSTCPHPRDQQCGCGSVTVTAAIPKKQACGCGNNTPPLSSGRDTPLEPIEDGIEALSPAKSSFKAQKTISKPQFSKKLSYDPTNLERMDMNSINIVPFEPRSFGVPAQFANGFAVPGAPQLYDYFPQYAETQAQFSHIPMPGAPHLHPNIPGGLNVFDQGYGNASKHSVDTPLATPTETTSGDSNTVAKPGSCCAPPVSPKVTTSTANLSEQIGSCCAPKQPSHSHSSSSVSCVSEPTEIKTGSCCSKPVPLAMKQEPTSIRGTPIMAPQMPLPNGYVYPPLYPQYLPQATIFTYPPTYASFHNPLQPSAWRQGALANSYGNHTMPTPLPLGSLPYDTPIMPDIPNTVHNCGCGDGCLCVGCAAHPYNVPTRNAVHEAYTLLNKKEQGSSELYTHEHSNGNGYATHPGAETISSPAANTPSSTTSVNGEEQNLSASDYLFVTYPFPSEAGCGGDTENCPCGDDCQCLGCTIHQQLAEIPCAGEKDGCPCGEGCECIGCSIHSGSL